MHESDQHTCEAAPAMADPLLELADARDLAVVQAPLNRRIGFYDRLVAYVIDLLALLCLVPPMLLSLWLVTSRVLDVRMNNLHALLLSPVVFGLVILIEALPGGFVGRRMIGAKVGREDQTPARPRQLLLRALLKHLPLVLLAAGLTAGALLHMLDSHYASVPFAVTWPLAGYAWLVVIGGGLMILSPRRQALHDRIAGTALFRADALRAREHFGFTPLPVQRASQVAAGEHPPTLSPP